MPESVAELVRRDMECEGLLECLHGLRHVDRAVFEELADAGEPLTVDEVAEAVDRERSTAYRAVERLRDAGFAQRDRITFEEGSYAHVYSLRDPEAVADEMLRLVNDWYAQVGMLIREFEDTYGEQAATAGRS